MATISNLTFEQLNDELTTPAFSYAAGDITVSLAAITGDTYTGLTDSMVVEAIWKLRNLCATAQETVNAAADPEDVLLDAFPPASNGIFNPETYTLPLSGQIRAQIQANPDNVIGQSA